MLSACAPFYWAIDRAGPALSLIHIFSTDSTCDLPAELIAAHNIGVLPLYIIRDGEALRDGIDVTPDDLYAYTKATGKLCGTSAVTIADYLTAWNGWLEDCDAVVHEMCIRDRRWPGRLQ